MPVRVHQLCMVLAAHILSLGDISTHVPSSFLLVTRTIFPDRAFLIDAVCTYACSALTRAIRAYDSHKLERVCGASAVNPCI